MLQSRSVVRIATAGIVLVCGALLVASPQVKPTAAATPWIAPRTADGQPDLQGMWTNYDPTPFERLNTGERVPPRLAVSTQDWLVQDSPTSPRRPSMVVDPPDGKVPLKREAIEKRDASFALVMNGDRVDATAARTAQDRFARLLAAQ